MDSYHHRVMLIAIHAEELARAYEDARATMAAPVMVLVDAEDTLGRTIHAQFELKPGVNVLPVPQTQVFDWLSGSEELQPIATALLTSTSGSPTPVMPVLVIAEEGASLELIPL